MTRAAWPLAVLLVLAGAPACAEERAPSAPTSSVGTPHAEPTTDPLADGPRRPTGAGDAARLLGAALTVIADPEESQDRLALAGHVEQLVVRELSTRPRWTARALRRLPRQFRSQTRANVEARLAFRSMHPVSPADLADELPAWRILQPPPAADLLRFYRDAERRFGVDWEYLAAINLVETAFGRIRGTSVAGAQGPMQFLPTTWDIYGAGGDINDPHDAILAAGRLLRSNGFRARQGRCAVSLQQLVGVRPWRQPARAGHAAAAARVPRLPRLAGLLPHRSGQRVARGGLRQASADPRRPLPPAAPRGAAVGPAQWERQAVP